MRPPEPSSWKSAFESDAGSKLVLGVGKATILRAGASDWQETDPALWTVGALVGPISDWSEVTDSGSKTTLFYAASAATVLK